MSHKTRIAKSELLQLYQNPDLSIEYIAKLFRCSNVTVFNWLRRFNITKTRKINSSKLNDLSKEKLNLIYWTKETSTEQIAKRFNCSRVNVCKKMKKFGIARRSHSEAEKLKPHGINHSTYIDGRTQLSYLIRAIAEYKNWRRKVFERDKFICQKCFRKVSGKLEAHHDKKSFSKLLSEFLKEYNQFSPIEDKETLVRLAIKWQPFWDINNGKTLCGDCHKRTFNYGGKIVREETR